MKKILFWAAMFLLVLALLNPDAAVNVVVFLATRAGQVIVELAARAG